MNLGFINPLQLRVYIIFERKTSKSPWVTFIHIEWPIPTNLVQEIGTIMIDIDQL